MLNTTPYTAFALLVALPASAQAQILTFNPTEANAAVVEADLNAQTSGGSWTISAAGMDQFVFLNDGAGGTDYAYLFRDSSASNPFPNGNYSQVTLTTPVDFTVQPIVVSADMAYTDTNGGQTRPWSMIGFSGSTEVFRFDWTVPATDNNPAGFIRARTNENAANDMGTIPVALMGSTVYEPSNMATFTVTLDGANLTYTAEGASNNVTGTVLNAQTQLTSIRWVYTSTGDPAGLWLDNISVTQVPEPTTVGMLVAVFASAIALRRRRA